MAMAVAKQAGAKELVLFHHDPSHSDDQLAEIERASQKEFDALIMAREGLVIEL
jgi:ribonuclease BN (tRNA processing enzyme)